MKVFIIRHGEVLNQSIPVLSDGGRQQAIETGRWLRKYFKENNISFSDTIIIYSPLERTLQTCELVNSAMKIEKVEPEENIIEQEYGLFKGLSTQEQKAHFPRLYEEYAKIKIEKGRYYARFPGGESPRDVVKRLHNTVIKVKEFSEINNIVIISHATAIKCFLLDWFGYSPDVWYRDEPIPANCSVRLIDKERDYGYIYKP